MKLSNISRIVSFLRYTKRPIEETEQAVLIAIREFREMDYRLRSKDGMNSCRYLLNEIRLLRLPTNPLLLTLIPPIINCDPDPKLLSFAYFLYRKEQIPAHEFLIWTENRLAIEMANPKLNINDLMQALSGLSCSFGLLSEPQKRMLEGADRRFCANESEMLDPKVYTNILHTMAKAGYYSQGLKRIIEQRFPETMQKIANFRDDMFIGVMCSSACRMQLSPALLRREVFPLLMSDQFNFELKHIANCLFYVTEPEVFDEALFNHLLAKTEAHQRISPNLKTMIADAKQRANKLMGRN